MPTEGTYSYAWCYVLQPDLTFTRLTAEVIDFVRDELGLPRPTQSASWDPSGRQTEFFERPLSARVRLTGPAMKDSKSSLGAFRKAVEAEAAQLMQDLARLQEPLMVRPRPVDTAGISSILKEIYESPVAANVSSPSSPWDRFKSQAAELGQYAKNLAYVKGLQWIDVERSDEPFWTGEPGQIIEYSVIPPGTVTKVPPVVVQLTPARVYFDAD